jgi:hypothetical protein
VRSIEIARIVGSVCRAHELDTEFRRRVKSKPASIENQRFARVLQATKDGVTLPPISVFQIGFGYYVEDGHHRVAAARLTGQTEIDADVVEFVPADEDQRPMLHAQRDAFERATGLLDLGAAHAGSYECLEDAIRAFAVAEGLEDIRRAARRWESRIYRPLWAKVREREVSAAYPGDRTADTVARVAELHLRTGVDWETALEEVAAG